MTRARLLLALALLTGCACARQEPRWDISVPVEVTTCYPCWGERLACGPQVCLSGQYHAGGRWVAQMRGRPTWQLDCLWRHEPPDFGRVTGAVCEPPSVQGLSGACVVPGGVRADPGR